MAIEGFQCEINVRPVADWVAAGKNKDHCPTCLMKALVSFYMGDLEQAGEKKALKELDDVWTHSGDPLTIAKTMDKIKSEVGDALRKSLVVYDCAAQSYKESEETQSEEESKYF